MCNIDKFDTTIKMLNNELASYTWARLTWEQRVTLVKDIFVSSIYKLSDREVYYHSKSGKTTIHCTTLSQMQF